jgi:PI-3-kinase-related kinase SMG-1
MIENQLQNVHALSGASSEQLALLVEIWRDAQKRIYSYYELSAMAYFKYLELCGDKEVFYSVFFYSVRSILVVGAC